MNAIFAGSFDPFTTEHKYIAETACEEFDKVYIVIAVNSKKNKDNTGMFTVAERIKIAELSCPFKNAKVMATTRLIVDLAKDLKVQRLVRGLRHTTEYEYELRIATGNLLIGGIKTIGVFPRTTSISSSDVRELINFKDTRWTPYVDPAAVDYINTIIKERLS